MKPLLIASAVLLLTACQPAGTTYVTAGNAQSARIDVSATGNADVAPDRAVVTAGVVAQGKTAREAMMSNATMMTAAFDELKAAKIDKKNITTSQLSLQPQYDYRDRQKPTITGYEARNTVTVKTDDIDQVGPMLDALVKAGVNNINQVQFTVKDPKSALEKARMDAIREAKAKAEAMAVAAGVKLGPLMSLSESGNGNAQPIMMRSASYGAMSDSVSTPISAGDQTLSVRVNLSYGIAE